MDGSKKSSKIAYTHFTSSQHYIEVLEYIVATPDTKPWRFGTPRDLEGHAVYMAKIYNNPFALRIRLYEKKARLCKTWSVVGRALLRIKLSKL